MVAIDLDMSKDLDKLDKWLEGVENRLNNLGRVRTPVLREMASQNQQRMKYRRGHPESDEGFAPPATFYIGSTSAKYARGLWISHPEWVLDIIIKYALDGAV